MFFVSNESKVAVKSIRSVNLKLSCGFVLILSLVLSVPSMKRNLVSASKLVESGFTFVGDTKGIEFFHSNNLSTLLGIALLNEDVWQLQCSYVNECFNVYRAGSKRLSSKENSSTLWRKCVGHISKERILLVTKQKLVPNLDFDNFIDCIDCFKGKLTNTRKFGLTRSQNLLEIIHINVCGSFPNQTICGNKYFVSFIDFSRFAYIYLISKKASMLDCFKTYKLEVENQLENKLRL